MGIGKNVDGYADQTPGTWCPRCGAHIDDETWEKYEMERGYDLTRGEITRYLSEMTENLINPLRDPRIYLSKEVTFDYMTGHAIRVGYMHFIPCNNTVSGIEKGDFSCYEIKSSTEDFRSKNGHNFIGDYNYYVIPHDVFLAIKDEIPLHIGVYCPCGGKLKSVKKARRVDRNRPVSEMLLMMFRSLLRDALKNRQSEHE